MKIKISKSALWTSVAFSVVGVLNLILFAILTSTGVFKEPRSMAYLFAASFIVVAWVPFLLTIIFKMQFNLVFLISFHIYSFLAICGGSQWELYTAGFQYDKIIHTIGGFMFAFLAYSIFINCRSNKLNLFWLFVLVFSFSMMCGGVWEIYEYVTDGLIGNNAQGWQGLVGREALTDTMLDLICDFAGAVFGGVLAVLLEWKRNKPVVQPEWLEQEKAQEVQAAEK